MGTTVAPEQILKELAALWVDSGKQGQAEGGTGVLRACSMTLLVLAEAREDTQSLGESTRRARFWCGSAARAIAP